MNKVLSIPRACKFAALVVLTTLSVGCSSFTSIELQQNGQYVVTGWQAPGPRGFVWICDYDPNSQTLTVVEQQ